MTFRQYFCGDGLNYLNEKTKLVESDISYRIFRISNALLHHLAALLVWVYPLVFSYKKVFESDILLFFYLLALGSFSFGLLGFVFLSLKYKLFLKRMTLFYHIFGQIAVTATMSLFALLTKCKVRPNGEESCTGMAYVWIIGLIAIAIFYTPATSRISKGIIIPLKKLRRTLSEEN